MGEHEGGKRFCGFPLSRQVRGNEKDAIYPPVRGTGHFGRFSYFIFGKELKMKRIFLPILIIGCMILIAAACSEEGEDEGATATVKRSTVSKYGLIKEPTRPHPGWVCPLHPYQKSMLGQHKCPLCGSQLVREGEWTCPEHPQVSATEPGRCPLCKKELIRVEELEKREGKTIAELMKLELAKEKEAGK